ncbi:acyltransferase family protein [Granulicella tundricola]|uniref:Acyltransferase 3 n=1 Tax=Granulicella tundricola (strain ATCC BAA-1859 / DSM 23138 / MP5ACTX9) TaxID=1198114 RepID=E8X6J2_GRATM|nr:acyltransferase [Granulicella tundricola]ADW71142.1 acyltransferase 3 [Granulicella tundricola MP5ACTX9]
MKKPRSLRENNFDIVRILLALIVVFVHSYELSQQRSLRVIDVVLNSRFAVEGFFTISGFLIFASYERSRSLREYAANRAWRILPGYWLSTVVCLVIAFVFGQFHVGRFLAANLTFLNTFSPDIPGVFTGNASRAMNGALWTIKVEVMFYVAVPLIVWLCRKTHRDAMLLILFLSSIAYRMVLANHTSLAQQLPGQLSFFVMGSLVYYHLPLFKRHGWWLVAASVAVYGLHRATDWFFLRPAPVAIFILAACLLLPQVKGPTRWGDFSYGTYILHFPIIQLLIHFGLFQLHPWTSVGLVLLILIPCAALSWFLIERPCLEHARSRRLREAALGHTTAFPPAVP